MAKGIAGRTQGIHQADGGFQTNVGVVAITEERVLKFDDDGGGGIAGVFTMVPIDIPAGATIQDIRVQAIALWNAGTSAVLLLGDTEDPNGFYDNVNLKATDLLANQILSFETMDAHGIAGAYLTQAANLRNTYRSAATKVTAIVTLVGTAATTGELRVLVTYVVPIDFVKTSTYVAT